ncbi:hypothetical protein JW926_04010 [Candidatus Sumerlaeota bacterium]|nr:hypothetical protein [Candidatus Sumerlaeota bacterium]
MYLFKRHSKGSAILLVLVFIVIIGWATGILLSQSFYQRRANARYAVYHSENNAAEYALNKMISEIIFLGTYKPEQVGGGIENFHNAVLNIQPPMLEGYVFTDVSITCIQGENLEYEIIDDPTETWTGFPALQIIYQLRVRAKGINPPASNFEHPGVVLERDVQVLNIPLYVFGIFYNNLLEIWPGPQFDMHGRVHSNIDLWLGANTGANYWEHVTSAGNLFAGRAPGSGKQGESSGPVKIFNGDSLKSMKLPNGVWLDSAVDNWKNLSEERWNNYFRDKAHGVRKLNLPIPSYEDPHALIERADPENDDPALKDIKFENKADLKILRNPVTNEITGYDNMGNIVPLTYEDPDNPEGTKSVYKESMFYNNRENKFIRCLDLDIANLKESGIDLGNGMAYMSEEPNGENVQASCRIINGAHLPATMTGSMTIASDDPVYVQGDFNVGENRIPALVSGDAINILSNAWNDDANDFYRHGLQYASVTETNAIFMGGNVPSGTYDNTYSGGAENYFRYLENWSGRTHAFRGSLLNLWESDIAIGPWIYGKPYYEAPKRDWRWDSVLGGINPPPGMLSFFQVNPLVWRVVPESEMNLAAE